MVFQYTKYNIQDLMQTIGFMKREQLLRYFEEEMPEKRVQGILDQLVYEQELRYNPETDIYTYYAYDNDIYKPEYRDKFIEAFWVIAASGSKDVVTVSIMKSPTQYFWIDSRNNAFDVTIVDSLTTARNAAIMRRFTLVKAEGSDFVDDVTHIALTKNRDFAKYLGEYGFDFVCTLDPVTKLPSYFEV